MGKGGIFFVAAGSGGHVYAAVATFRRFKRDFPTLAKNTLFVGSNLLMEGEKGKQSIEERITAHHNIPFVKIRMGKLQRKLSFRLIKNLRLTLLGFFDAWMLIRKRRPSVIVAFGGYVTLPVVIVGKWMGAKILIHEQTSSIGLTNKLLERYADKVAVAFSTSVDHFKKEAIVVGSPTMRHIYSIKDFTHLLRHLKREKSSILSETDYIETLKNLEATKKRKRPLLLLSGGSQGSHFLNEQIKDILPELLKEWTVYIQTGENQIYKDFDRLTDYVKSLPSDLGAHCIVRKFIFEEFGYLMQNADLFVGRSGANTVYQLGMTGLRSILVPIAWVVKNEQYTNAKILKDAGYAKILDENKMTPKDLLKAIESMREQGKTEKKKIVFPTDAAEKLAKQIAVLAV